MLKEILRREARVVPDLEIVHGYREVHTRGQGDRMLVRAPVVLFPLTYVMRIRVYALPRVFHGGFGPFVRRIDTSVS